MNDKSAVLNRRERIEDKLAQHLSLLHLEVLDESHGHHVPAGAGEPIKVVAVSEAFADKRLIQRHRLIHELVSDEFDQGMHAIAIHAYTQAEWQERFSVTLCHSLRKW